MAVLAMTNNEFQEVPEPGVQVTQFVLVAVANESQIGM